MIRNIDIDLLRAFLMIYEARSFSHAAERLGRTQSTISQQIKKLEDILGHALFLRSNRSVNLTTEGEVLLPYARQMVGMNDEVFGRISQPNIQGTVRLGAPEAFAANHLMEPILQFSKSHPSVGLEVRCDLSDHLMGDFERGDFDIVLIKRDSKTKIFGNKVWREQLIWAGQEKRNFKMDEIVPLVLSPTPCVYRSKMIDALDRKKIKWAPVFTSSSITSRIAAAKSGLGVTVIPKELLSDAHGLQCLDEGCGLPNIRPIEIDLIQKKQGISDAGKRLAEHIIFALENNPSLAKAS